MGIIKVNSKSNGGKSMVEPLIRNRHRLRKKEVRELSQKFDTTFSTKFNFENSTIDSATFDNFEILIIDNEMVGFIIQDTPFFTIRGLLRYRPKRRFVTVDMGAVKFISNGADVMSPGIVDADLDIQAEDIVWVCDENNNQPLAVGVALMTGPVMIQSTSEKAVRVIHYVGDKLWTIKL